MLFHTSAGAASRCRWPRSADRLSRLRTLPGPRVLRRPDSLRGSSKSTMKKYDLVAIGTGTAATVAASRCRAAGWRVAIIDHLPFGGTCALRGCDPKKVLVGAAEAVDDVRRLRGKGIAGGEPSIDWRALIAFKRGFTDPVPPMKEKSFAKD